MQQSTEAHGGAHNGHEPHVPGVTHDAVLRPVGTIMMIIGCLWALFIGMAVRAGTFGVPKAAGALILAGVVLFVIGKPSQKI
jgi:hypothetical protein